jgi:hypothetical protein
MDKMFSARMRPFLTAALVAVVLSGCTSHAKRGSDPSNRSLSLAEILVKADDPESFGALAEYLGAKVPFSGSTAEQSSPGFILENHGEIESVQIVSFRNGIPRAIALLAAPGDCIDLDRLKAQSGAGRGRHFHDSDQDFSYVFLSQASVTFISRPQSPACLGSIQLKRND